MEQDHKCMLYTFDVNRLLDQADTFNVKYELLSSVPERFCGLTTGTRSNLVCQLISALAALRKVLEESFARNIVCRSHIVVVIILFDGSQRDWQKYMKYTVLSVQRFSIGSPEDVTNISSRRCCIERPLNTDMLHISFVRNIFLFAS